MHDHDSTHLLKHALVGVGAGLAGTAVMFAMRSFDAKYAGATIPKAKEDPGLFAVHQVERLAGTTFSSGVEHGAALSAGLAYGTTFGLLYSLAELFLPAGRPRHPLVSGSVLGGLVYAASYLGLLPAVGLTRPATDQPFPQVAGELTRHVAYGVATAAAYGVIHDAL